MTDKNLFKLAARRKTRFNSTRGPLTAEQLYDLKLPDLDATARAVNAELKSITEESFIQTTPDPRRGLLQDALDLVIEVIADKQLDAERATKRAAKADLKRTLTDALARAEAEKLAGTSIADLQKQLAALKDDDDA
jgi:enoyl-CoA hydratase/carnithine racemase